MTALNGEENFNVIVDAAVGTLIGLQFVVMTLIAAKSNHKTFVHSGGKS